MWGGGGRPKKSFLFLFLKLERPETDDFAIQKYLKISRYNEKYFTGFSTPLQKKI